MKGDITPLLAAGIKLFSGYDESWFRLNDRRYDSSLAIHANEVTAPWGPQCLAELGPEHLQMFTVNPPEVLILGTGRQTRFPDAEIMRVMADAHIGFECMDSRSAARTYNILISEGRRVSAALLLAGIRR